MFIGNVPLAIVQAICLAVLLCMILAQSYTTLRAHQRRNPDGMYDKARCKADGVELEKIPGQQLTVKRFGLPMAAIVVVVYAASQIWWVSFVQTYLVIGGLVAATMFVRQMWGLSVCTKMVTIDREQRKNSEPTVFTKPQWDTRERIRQYYRRVFEVKKNNIGYMRVVDYTLAILPALLLTLGHVFLWPATIVAAQAYHTWSIRDPQEYNDPTRFD